jgi:hypothetical protein
MIGMSHNAKYEQEWRAQQQQQRGRREIPFCYYTYTPVRAGNIDFHNRLEDAAA